MTDRLTSGSAVIVGLFIAILAMYAVRRNIFHGPSHIHGHSYNLSSIPKPTPAGPTSPAIQPSASLGVHPKAAKSTQ